MRKLHGANIAMVDRVYVELEKKGAHSARAEARRFRQGAEVAAKEPACSASYRTAWCAGTRITLICYPGVRRKKRTGRNAEVLLLLEDVRNRVGKSSPMAGRRS